MAVKTKKKPSKVAKVVATPIRVIDCVEYVKLSEPKNSRFSNKSKPINKIDTTHTHNVVEHYKHMA